MLLCASPRSLDFWCFEGECPGKGYRTHLFGTVMSTTVKQARSHLDHISPDRIRRNPDNPRLFFRSVEMDTLMASIRRYGIRVPISVYEDGNQYFLIDGERRWRCALKLNIDRIPALVHTKPT